MSRIDLPSGWAELCSPRKVQERKRRRYLNAMADLEAATALLPQVPNPNFGKPGHAPTMPSQMGAEHMELADRMGDMLILSLVREWSFGEVSEEALKNLDADNFDALFRRCRALASELVPDYSPDPDPKAPTSESQLSPPTSSADDSTSPTLSSAATS